MPKYPALHALLALAYIVAVALLMQNIAGSVPAPDTIAAPIVALSLFTLSAAVMGYLFLSQPIQLYLDGKKAAAVTFFLKTVGVFAILTLCMLVVLVSGVVA